MIKNPIVKLRENIQDDDDNDSSNKDKDRKFFSIPHSEMPSTNIQGKSNFDHMLEFKTLYKTSLMTSLGTQPLCYVPRYPQCTLNT